MGTKDEANVYSQDTGGETVAVVEEKYADVTLRIVEEHGEDFAPLTPEGEKKLRRKLYWHVMGLLSAINLLLFVSRTSFTVMPSSKWIQMPDRQINSRICSYLRPL